VSKSFGSRTGVFGRRSVFRASCPGRVREHEAWREKALERLKPRRGSTIGTGQLGSVRTDSQEDQGFEAGEAGGTGEFRFLDPGRPGSVLRRVERESIVVGGIRQLRESVGVEETGGDKVWEASSSTSVDDRKGACGPERGARFL
jgi:hypothetical protein